MILNSVWLEKDLAGYRLCYFNTHMHQPRISIISILNQNDFDFMMSHFTIMSEQRNIEALPYYYIFPRQGIEFVELVVRLIKHKDFFYTLDLNLGVIRLSEMNETDFEELMRDLTMLQTREIGSKVYFPTMKK
jgi:hypothetical protein